MTISIPQYSKLARMSALLLIGAYLLSGCAGGPSNKEPTIDPPDGAIRTPEPGVSLPASQYNYLFANAEQLLSAFDWMAASRVLAEVDTTELNGAETAYLQYLNARLHYLKGEQGEAAELAGELSLSVNDPALVNKIHNFQRYMLRMSGDTLASAQLGDIRLERGGADQTNFDALYASIWRDLQEVPAAQLKSAMRSSQSPRWQGWLDLAALTAETPNCAALERGLLAWQAENPDHPGANTLPGGLGHLLDRPGNAQKVALILPLSGRLAEAAKAVRDGFLANYYRNRPLGDTDYEIVLIDLDQYNSVVDAYEEAVTQGVQLVIGPLSKNNVAALGAHPHRPVPILTLNQIEGTTPVADAALIQLALAPEDEAQQIADLAFGSGARRAMVIRPEGNWGAKMERALVQRWQSLGGQLSSVANYSSQEDYSSSMAGALNLSQSEQRARDLRSMLATNIEFTARRRADIDVIFLLGRSAGEARSLKPLLPYHYAGDLPVYATSSIYRGKRDSADKDLNGVQLVEMPWLLGGSPELHSDLAAGNSNSDRYTRLNALGADAYLLLSRFDQFEAGPDALIRGSTGLLSLDPQLRIRRHLYPAKFGGGVLRVL